ncbi:MAG: hypothetical protein PVH17_07770 [Anaerolineae bacterium]|jgi:KDO2-lipid IV(A) lauroyltransferase
MNFQNVINDPRAMRMSMFLSRHTPERIGYRLSWFLSGLISWIKPTVYDVVWTNLSQVLGSDAGQHGLEKATRCVFHTAIRSYYDLYRALSWPRERIFAAVKVTEAAREVFKSLWGRERGSVLVFPHLGNFDLGGQVISSMTPDMQLLTLPDPPPGFQLTNELRMLSGVHVTPLSSVALRRAIRLLRQGGVVSIAGDRPVSDLDKPFLFFGRPARLPSGHVRLALKTGAAVIVAYCVYSAERASYSVHCNPPLEMIRTGDREEEIRLNMQRVLDILESIIVRWPEQWQMFVPVWPQLLKA